MSLKQVLEANKAEIDAQNEDAHNRIRESIMSEYGIDIDEKNQKTGKLILDFKARRISFRKLRESSVALSREIKERNTAGTFGALMRVGVQTIANDRYKAVPVTFRNWVMMTNSDKFGEFYAPLHRAGMPKRKSDSEPFKSIDIKGLDVQIQNYVFGSIVGFARTLVDDDQSGQIARKAADMGENMGVYMDAYAYARLINVATDISGDPVPISPAYGSGVWSTSLPGGGANRPSSYGRFGKQTVQTAFASLRKQKDLLGNKIVVMPDTILISPDDEMDADIMANSEYFPATPIGTAGKFEGIHGSNPFRGKFVPIVSPWMPDKAWVLMEAGKGPIFQTRDPVEMVQENPQSGDAFAVEEFRYKTRARFECDWVDQRFAWLGNDGSV